jgi:hypothetical protein
MKTEKTEKCFCSPRLIQNAYSLRKDPVLIYETALEQIEETTVKLVTLLDGHMSHIENKMN